ncbi:MAG: intradiol ring-cleavage dioxygenase [Brevundimonas sp.]|nr:MAG: intradiol ring-cleavage dioxygenase [Brevundimonas sp.]
MRPDRRSVCLGGMAGMVGALAGCSQIEPARAEGQDRGPRANLYACEGCEATAERDPQGISWTAVLAGPEEPGERLRLTGRVYQTDGVTPAPSVIIYAHQTNAGGLYANGSNETEWSRRHGRLRGWVRTNIDGDYVFETIKPAPYPSMTMPAHIHLFVQELGRRPYYIDDVVFDGAFGVDDAYRARQELRGGSGIVRLVGDARTGWTAVRDIRLERHPG